MIIDKMDQLVDQSLEGWKIERWFAISKTNGYSERRLVGYCRYASTVEFLGQRTTNQQQRPTTTTSPWSIKPVFVLTNQQVMFNLKTGKPIKQTAELVRADARAKETERLRLNALAKLTAAEKRALGVTI